MIVFQFNQLIDEISLLLIVINDFSVEQLELARRGEGSLSQLNKLLAIDIAPIESMKFLSSSESEDLENYLKEELFCYKQIKDTVLYYMLKRLFIFMIQEFRLLQENIEDPVVVLQSLTNLWCLSWINLASISSLDVEIPTPQELEINKKRYLQSAKASNTDLVKLANDKAILISQRIALLLATFRQSTLSVAKRHFSHLVLEKMDILYIEKRKILEPKFSIKGEDTFWNQLRSELKIIYNQALQEAEISENVIGNVKDYFFELFTSEIDTSKRHLVCEKLGNLTFLDELIVALRRSILLFNLTNKFHGKLLRLTSQHHDVSAFFGVGVCNGAIKQWACNLFQKIQNEEQNPSKHVLDYIKTLEALREERVPLELMVSCAYCGESEVGINLDTILFQILPFRLPVNVKRECSNLACEGGVLVDEASKAFQMVFPSEVSGSYVSIVQGVLHAGRSASGVDHAVGFAKIFKGKRISYRFFDIKFGEIEFENIQELRLGVNAYFECEHYNQLFKNFSIVKMDNMPINTKDLLDISKIKFFDLVKQCWKHRYQEEVIIEEKPSFLPLFQKRQDSSHALQLIYDSHKDIADQQQKKEMQTKELESYFSSRTINL